MDGTGGDGGFGAGGGGAATNAAGQGGFGAGNGGLAAGGDGGSGLGGAVFVRQGGTFTILNSNTSGNGAAAGTGVVDGQAAGQDLDLMSGVNAGFGGSSNTYTGSIGGLGSITQSSGITTLTGLNTYSGGTTVSGGLLAGDTNGIQGDILNNSQVLFMQSFDGTYSGAMSGSGQLYKSNSGNVTLSGPNTYSGGTFVDAGTLTGTSTSLQGNIQNNATTAFDQNFDGSYFGNITGIGQFRKAGTGNLTVTGANSQGSFLVEAGTLTGTTDSLVAPSITDDATLVYDQNFNGIVNGQIGGAGQLIKSGTGSVTLANTNSFAGTTDILAGRLAVDGSIAGNAIVYSGATLGGHGTIGGNVFNSGTVAPGNSIGTLTINGSYDALAGSTQQVEINDAGTTPGVNNDLLVVNGGAWLHGGTVEVHADPGTYTTGTTYRFLQADDVFGHFDDITSTGLGSLHAALGYEEFGGFSYAFFTLFDNQTNFLANAETYNERQIATYLDNESSTASGEFLDILDDMQTLSPPEQRVAMNQMTGVANGTLAQLNVQDTAFLYMMLRRRVGSSFAAGGLVGGGEGWASLDSKNRAGKDFVVPVGQKGITVSSSNCAYPVPGRSAPSWGGWTAGYGFGGRRNRTETRRAESTVRAARSWPSNGRPATLACGASLAPTRISACRSTVCRRPPPPIRACLAPTTCATWRTPT